MPAQPNESHDFQSTVPHHLESGLHSRGRLPHLKRQGASYFVTFRLNGTLPGDVIAHLQREGEEIRHNAELGNQPLTWAREQELFRWYAAEVDAYLDRGDGDCWLRKPEIAELVAGAIKYFDGNRYFLSA